MDKKYVVKIALKTGDNFFTREFSSIEAINYIKGFGSASNDNVCIIFKDIESGEKGELFGLYGVIESLTIPVDSINYLVCEEV